MAITEKCHEPPHVLELLARARAGDAEAFCELVQACESRLLRQAFALCKDPSLAEDLASETFVAAWKSLGRYNHTCRFSTWLFSILLHRFQKSARRARTRPVPLGTLHAAGAEEPEALLGNLPASGLSPAEEAARADRNARLRQCIDALPARHRAVVLLRFFEDASLSEIAAITGASLGTVKSRLHYALEKLRHMQAEMNLSQSSGDA